MTTRSTIRWIAALLLTLVTAPRLVIAAPADSPVRFSLNSSFMSTALRDVAQQEPDYISYNDCAHWLSSFLRNEYGLPAGWTSTNATELVQYLVRAGIASVVTGDRKPDSGSLISEDDARTQYFSDYSSYSAYLNRFLVENGGSYEFILAYKWTGEAWDRIYSHVALYTGGGRWWRTARQPTARSMVKATRRPRRGTGTRTLQASPTGRWPSSPCIRAP